MLPRIAQWLLGDSWRTSLAALVAAILYAAQDVPAIVDGTATREDYWHAGFAAGIYVLGRMSKDISGALAKEERPK